MRRRWLLPVGASALAGLGALVSLVPDLPVAVHAVVGAAAVAAPGLALTHLIWPGRIGGALRTVFVVSGSVAVLVLAAVLTAALPVGMTSVSVAVTVLIATVVFSALALVLPRAVAGGPDEAQRRAVRRRDVVGVVAAAAIAVAAVVVAHAEQRRTVQRSAYTQLWVVPARSSTAVTVGVHSAERSAEDFRLTVRSRRGATFTTTVPSIHLRRGETFERTLALPAGVSRDDLRISLYRAGSDHAYRTVG